MVGGTVDNAIANAAYIAKNFGVAIGPSSAYCPVFSEIASKPTLVVSGGVSYSINQLVLCKDIHKKEVTPTPVTTCKLTISNLNTFLKNTGYTNTGGIWRIYVGSTEYDGGSYPVSYLRYNDKNIISGTTTMWTNIYNTMSNNEWWDSIDLVNSQTNQRFCLSDYSNAYMSTTFANLKNGNNQTITLNLPLASSVSINLNNEWSTGTTNPSTSTYYSFESAEHRGVDSSGDYIYLTIQGYTEYTFYIRSYGESNYDYVIVSKPDVTITNYTSYNSPDVYAHTRGLSTSTTGISAYTKVTFTGLTTAEHNIMIVYRKDGSNSSGSDAGYVLIPSGANVNYVNMRPKYTPAS